MKTHKEPYDLPKDIPVHKKGAFNFPAPGNEPVMDGWAALKILNTLGHPQRALIQQRVHLVSRTVGERYLRLYNAEQAHNLYKDNPNNCEQGGDQYLDTQSDPDLAWLEDFEFSTKRTGQGSLPDPEEVEAAYEEALEEITMLKLCKYKVSYYNPVGGWMERWPEIGDLVDVPADLHADLETEEPLESRPSAATHLYDDRWFDNHRPNQLSGHFSPDPLFQRISLNDYMQETCNGLANSVVFSTLADRKGRNMWEVAIWKLAEYGELQVSASVQRRYNLKPIKGKDGRARFSATQLCRFIMWAHRRRFPNKWEFDWIVKSIYAYHNEPESWWENRGRCEVITVGNSQPCTFKNGRFVSC